MQELIDEVKDLRQEVGELDESLEQFKAESAKAKPKVLVGSSLVPDPDFKMEKQRGPIRKCLEAVGKQVTSVANGGFPKVSEMTSGNLGRVNYAVTAATMQQVGRSVQIYLFLLEMLGRIFGTDWHITESVRLFDQFRENVVWDTRTLGGVTFSYWRFRSNWKVDGVAQEKFDSGPLGNKAPDGNDKELDLGTKSISDMVYRFFVMLHAGHGEFRERALWGLEFLLRYEFRRALVGLGPDRVQHPWLCHTLMFWQQGEIASMFPGEYETVAAKLYKEFGSKAAKAFPLKATDRIKQCAEIVSHGISVQEDEMGPAEQMMDGKLMKFWYWAYNVLAATEGAKPNSKGEYEDGAQPLVYVAMMQTLLMQAGIYGLGSFAERGFQEKLANTQYAGVYGTPVKHRPTDSDVWVESYGWNSHAPLTHRVIDGFKNPKEVKRFPFTAKNSGKKRVIITRAVNKNDQGEGYFYANKEGWGDEVGLSLLFASEPHRELAAKEWGTPDDIKTKGQDLGWVCGHALRLGLDEGLATWD